MNKGEGLILLAEELGVDMVKIYQQACYYPQRLPEFRDIYDQYKIDVIQINLAITVPALSEQLDALRSGIDFENLKPVDIQEVHLRNDIELIEYLLTRHYSFLERGQVFNSPTKGVW